MKEQWKNLKVEGGEDYLVSNQGNVKNKHGRVLKHFLSPDGKRRYALKINGKRRIFYASRLVALTWLPDAKRKLNQKFYVFHLDGVAGNDSLDNLKLMKRAEGLKMAHEKYRYDVEDYAEEIYNKFYVGQKPEQISEEIGIPVYQIKKWLSRNGCRYRKYGSQQYYDETFEKIRKLYWLGENKTAIARKLNIYRDLVEQALE